MDNHIRKLVANVLKKLDFVNWDRYFGENGCWTFFGWIDREKDNYKDFVTLDFQLEKNDILISYATSSAERTEEIAEILNCSHSACSRIEYFCDGENIIKENNALSTDNEVKK